MGRVATVLEIQVHWNHAFATQDIIGAMFLPLVRTQMSVFLVPTIAFHRPDVSTHQGPIAASALLSWGGPSMANLVRILTSASIQTCATHRLPASIFQGDLSAIVTWDGEDKAHIQYALTSMNVLKGQIGNFRFSSIVVLTFVTCQRNIGTIFFRAAKIESVKA